MFDGLRFPNVKKKCSVQKVNGPVKNVIDQDTYIQHVRTINIFAILYVTPHKTSLI